MTKQEYNAALDKTHIPRGPDWNQRYLAALKSSGLKLLPVSKGQEQVPEAEWGPYMPAPFPATDELPSWGPSLIVPD